MIVETEGRLFCERYAKEFDESQVKRDEGGQFATKEGGGGEEGATKAEAPKAESGKPAETQKTEEKPETVANAKDTPNPEVIIKPLSLAERGELKRLQGFHGTIASALRLKKPLVEVTYDESQQLTDYLTKRIEKAQKDYDQAVKYRPSYATMPTRTENGMAVVLKNEQELLHLFQLEYRAAKAK